MSSQLTAYIYIGFSAFCGLCLLLLLFRENIYIKWFFLWMSISAAAFVVSYGFLFCVIVFILLFLFVTKNPGERVAIFLICLPVVPHRIGFKVPLPPLNYLFELTYPRLLTLCLLVPILFTLRHEDNTLKKIFRSESKTITWFIVLYACYLSMFAFRAESLTHSLRMIFLYQLDITIPYLAISLAVRDKRDFEFVFLALLFSSIMLAAIASMSQFKGWNFYGSILSDLYSTDHIRAAFHQIRGGMLRVAVSTGPTHLCYWLLLGTTALIYLYRTKMLTVLKGTVLCCLFLPAVYFTQARGGWLAFGSFITGYIYLHLTVQRTFSVQLFWAGIILMVGLIGTSFFGSFNLSDFDSYGTFEYRWELIKSSLSLVQRNLFLGAPMDSYMGSLEHMRQGQGIIDIVNTYLGILMEYGIVGSVLFVGIFISCLLSLVLVAVHYPVSPSHFIFIIRNILAAAIFAYLVMIATTSSTGIIPYYGWILASLCTALLNLHHDDRRKVVIRSIINVVAFKKN